MPKGISFVLITGFLLMLFSCGYAVDAFSATGVQPDATHTLHAGHSWSSNHIQALATPARDIEAKPAACIGNEYGSHAYIKCIVQRLVHMKGLGTSSRQQEDAASKLAQVLKDLVEEAAASSNQPPEEVYQKLDSFLGAAGNGRQRADFPSIFSFGEDSTIRRLLDRFLDFVRDFAKAYVEQVMSDAASPAPTSSPAPTAGAKPQPASKSRKTSSPKSKTKTKVDGNDDEEEEDDSD